MTINPKDTLIFLCALTALSLTGGYLYGRHLSTPVDGFTLVADTRPTIPVVQIEGIRNGLLHGNIKGNVRLVIADTVLVQSGVFVTDATTLLRNEIWVNVPSDMQFVASKRGKKYYPVDSAGGSRITPVNRVYFRTEEEAESAGYTQ